MSRKHILSGNRNVVGKSYTYSRLLPDNANIDDVVGIPTTKTDPRQVKPSILHLVYEHLL